MEHREENNKIVDFVLAQLESGSQNLDEINWKEFLNDNQHLLLKYASEGALKHIQQLIHDDSSLQSEIELQMLREIKMRLKCKSSHIVAFTPESTTKVRIAYDRNLNNKIIEVTIDHLTNGGQGIETVDWNCHGFLEIVGAEELTSKDLDGQLQLLLNLDSPGILPVSWFELEKLREMIKVIGRKKRVRSTSDLKSVTSQVQSKCVEQIQSQMPFKNLYDFSNFSQESDCTSENEVESVKQCGGSSKLFSRKFKIPLITHDGETTRDQSVKKSKHSRGTNYNSDKVLIALGKVLSRDSCRLNLGGDNIWQQVVDFLGYGTPGGLRRHFRKKIRPNTDSMLTDCKEINQKSKFLIQEWCNSVLY